MLTKDQMARAVSTTDVLAETVGIPGVCQRYDIEEQGLLYVAEQRGLRAAMVEAGRSIPAGDVSVAVDLPAQIRKRLPRYGALWMDGFVAGYTLQGGMSIPDGSNRIGS